jgi:hypothetical protein
MFLSGFKRDIFAATEQRVRFCQRCELGPERESIPYRFNNSPVAGAGGEKLFRGAAATGRGVASNLTFHNRKLHAAYPGGFPSAEDARLRRLLKLVNLDEPIYNAAV